MNTTTKITWHRRVLTTLTALAVLCGLLTLALIYLPVHGEEAIYDAVIRLHVLANSDSEEDQANKLAVRDAVLTSVTGTLSGCSDRAAAATALAPLLPELQDVAEQTLRARGSNHSVRITFCEEEYPTRDYDSFCFPAGNYLSLRVLIGEAEGQNFWCVLFPPLCMSAATVEREQAEEEFISVGLSKDQYSIITETENTKYRLRFKFLETFRNWFS